MKLKNGANIEYDWSAVTLPEWRAVLADEKNVELNDTFISKLIGMTIDEFYKLSPVDFIKIKNGLVKSFLSEIDTDSSKNLAGASTSD